MKATPKTLTPQETHRLETIRDKVRARLVRENDWTDDEKDVAFLLLVVDLLEAEADAR